MLYWTLVFILFAIASALTGISGTITGSAVTAQLFFLVILALLVLTTLNHMISKNDRNIHDDQ